jgi:4-hydroxybenzoate polyprenyltransferase
VAAGAFALIAASSADVVMRLGLGMLCLQFAIGVANDLADASTDALVKPNKPIPAGLVSRGHATGVFAVAATLGLAISATVGPVTFALGVVGLADGLLYDLRLKGTAFGWAPFAVGVGLLPVYAWSGASGAMPVVVPWVVSLAAAAGCALALANAFSDLDDDRRSGVASIATVLGPGRTLGLNAAILAGVNLVAGATTMGRVRCRV